jgi:thiamine-phosphate pyrophosphorylase
MMNTLPARGLYALTPQWYPERQRLLDGVHAVLEGGAALIQFRDKSADAEWRLETAAGLQAMCARFRVPLIINDDTGLAKACAAAGVHLGRDDDDPGRARSVLGGRALIGVSCYNRFDRAVTAAAAGADYLAFGSMYPSPTKPAAVQCEPGTLMRARELDLPLVAIGGITPENSAPLLQAGADFLAVISAVFEQEDIRAAAHRFRKLWKAD